MLHLINQPDAQGRWLSGGVGGWDWAPANRTYGRIDARIRFAAGSGFSGVALVWPSAAVWPPEIDFYEIGAHFGTRRTMSISNHYLAADSKHVVDQRFVNGNFASWHVISLRWTAASIKVYLDGVLKFTETDTAQIPHQDMWLGFQTHVEKVNGVMPVLPPGRTSVNLDVDWVRIYDAL